MDVWNRQYTLRFPDCTKQDRFKRWKQLQALEATRCDCVSHIIIISCVCLKPIEGVSTYVVPSNPCRANSKRCPWVTCTRMQPGTASSHSRSGGASLLCSCFAHVWAPFLRQRCGETRSDRSHIRTRMAWDRQIDVRGALQRGHAGSAAVTQRAGESCWPVRAAHGLRTRQRQALPPARGFPTSRKLLLPPARGSAPARVSTQTVLRVALIKPRTETAEPQ